MSLSWIVGDLKTGRINGRLPLTSDEYTLTIDDAGTMSGVLDLSAPENVALRPVASAEPGRCFLGAVWMDDSGEETILEAGPIWTHSYDGERRTLKIGAAGLWSYYDHRKIVPVLAAGLNVATVVSTTGPSSLGTIARSLIQLAHLHTNGALPVVLPAVVAGTEKRNYAGTELPWVGTALRELTEQDGGPEIAFIPRITQADDRKVEWVMSTGTPTKPLLVQAGLDWVWDASTVASPVQSISVESDGTRLASRAWAAGADSGENRLISYASDPTLPAAGWPLLEMEAEATDQVATTAILQSIARQQAANSALPIQTWTVKVRARDGVTPGKYRPGHWAQIIIGDSDPYLAEGTHRGRIVQVSGGQEDVIFQFQPATVI